MLKIWNTISNAGVKENTDFETKRRIILLNRIALTLFFIVFSLRTAVIALGFQEFSSKSFLPYVGMFAILLIPYFNKKGHYKLNAFIFSLITPLCFLFFGVVSQTSNTIININHYYIPRIFVMVSIVLPLILIDSKNKLMLYLAIGVNLLCVLLFNTVVKYFGVPFNPETINFDNYAIISRIMILASGLIILAFAFLTNLNRKYEKQIIGLNESLTNKNRNLESFNKEIIAQKDIISSKNHELEQYTEEVISQRDMITLRNTQLEDANKKIEHINQELTDSIIYAKTIQQAVLDEEKLPSGFFSDSFVFFKPKQHVSGDFYYYKKANINNSECLIVATIDCTGHGVPGGFLSMLGMTLINEILQNKQVKNAADILNQLRDHVKKTLKQTGKLLEAKDGMEMALCIYCPETKQIQYAGAQNPLCIIDKTGQINIIKGDRQPIGIFIKEEKFTNHHLQLSDGDMVYIFSDGLQDQFGGLGGKKLKFTGLQKQLLEIYSLPCSKQKEKINTFLHYLLKPNTTEAYEQIDDITIIGMRI